MKTKILTFGLAAAVVILAGFRMAEPSRKSTMVPVSITSQVRYFDDGKVVREALQVRKVRSDGSFVSYKVYPDKHPSLVHVSDYTTGLSTGYDPAAKTMIQQPLPAREENWAPTVCGHVFPKDDCKGPVDEMILGYHLEKVMAPNLNDGIVIEFLVAPDLSFMTLKKTVHVNGQLTEEQVAIEIVPGEPDLAAFKIPEGYQVVDRAGYVEKGSQARGRTANPKTIEKLRAIQEGKPPCQGCK
jgi:hypothetical protein